MIEVIQNPASQVFSIITFAVGITAISFIALVLFLDLQEQREPLQLPEKP